MSPAPTSPMKHAAGVAKDSVYRWIETRGLPAHKIGRLWKFRLSEINGWVEADGAAEPDKDGAVGKP